VRSSFGGAASSQHRLTGTLFGYRDGRVSLSLQQNARCQPTLIVELALPTHALLRELGAHAGARIVLEVEKRAEQSGEADGALDGNEAIAGVCEGGGANGFRHSHNDGWVLEELMWTMFCNGKKTGYAVRREATDDDLTVMETLRAVSMGAGVLPRTRAASLAATNAAVAADDEVPYMRGCFDHFIGSRDSESLYMIAPQGGGTGPELAVFFVRL